MLAFQTCERSLEGTKKMLYARRTATNSFYSGTMHTRVLDRVLTITTCCTVLPVFAPVGRNNMGQCRAGIRSIIEKPGEAELISNTCCFCTLLLATMTRDVTDQREASISPLIL